MTQRPGLLGRLAQLLRPARRAAQPDPRSAALTVRTVDDPGQGGATATTEITPPAPDDLSITYAPAADGDPDAGEIVWTWVPYDEKDGRGKDRPVLVIGRQDDECVYVVRLTSKSHDGDRDYLAIGSGAWDAKGRPSWVDVEQIYRVHRAGMRREASILDRDRFARVAHALQRRYGWASGD